MIHKRTIEEVRRYDIFKLSIVLVLLVLIFLMLLRDNEAASVATSGDESTVSESNESPSSDESGVDEAYPVEGDSTAAEEAYPVDSGTSGQGDANDPQSGDTMLFTPAPGAELGAGPNFFSGSGAPDSIVYILADGIVLGETVVDANGNWYLEADLATGERAIEVQSVDEAGTLIDSTETITIKVIEAEKEAGTPDLILDETNLYAGNVELSGSGEPGHEVIFFVAGVEAGTAAVAEDGSWNMPLDLEAGAHEISLQTMDENGDVVNQAGPFEVMVQEAIKPTVSLPDADVFTGGMILNGTGQPGTRVRLYANEIVIGETDVDDNGNYAVEVNLAVGRYNIDVATVDRSGNAVEILPALSLPVLALVAPELMLGEGEQPAFDPLSGETAWRGKADPGAQLQLIVDGEAMTEFEAGEDGTWDLQTELEPGVHEISLQQVDINGNVVAKSATISVELTSNPPALELPEHLIAGSDEGEGVIQLEAGAFDWKGRGTADEPVAIIVDGEVAGSATVDAEGNWIISTDLESGDYAVQLGTVDAAGSITNQSTAIGLQVVKISRPTMETPDLDDAGQGAVSGTADPDAVVTVTANGKLAGITSADENGSWTVNVNLGAGSFEMQAQVLDEEGNVLLSSSKQTVSAGATIEMDEAEHVIDAATVEGEYTTLLAGLEAAGLTGQLADVDEAFTLFAPTDSAFEALPDEIVEAWNENPEAYKEILFYLILEGAYSSEELADAEVLTTLAGTNIGITTGDGTVMINGVPIEASIPAGNSVVHAINQVILPPLGYQAQPPTINTSGVSIFTGDYLTVVGTAEPGTSILLQVSGENFGDLAVVDASGRWQVSDDITSGIHEILAYMVDENGLLMAISPAVSLPVQ